LFAATEKAAALRPFDDAENEQSRQLSILSEGADATAIVVFALDSPGAAELSGLSASDVAKHRADVGESTRNLPLLAILEALSDRLLAFAEALMTPGRSTTSPQLLVICRAFLTVCLCF
jgi:hypothetical protein